MNRSISYTSTAMVLAAGLALTGCSATSSASSSSSNDSGVSASSEVKDQLTILEAVLTSQKKAGTTGITETSSGNVYAYDPETNKSVNFYTDDQSGQPAVWQEGNTGSVFNQLTSMAMGTVTDVSSSSDEITFTASSPSGDATKYTITLVVKDGLIVAVKTGDEYSNYKTTIDYKVTDAAKDAFATAISPEEAYQQQEQYYEEPPM